ncbi:uncharacterized protein LTR77_000614 [Saxophila tyrrhenica]|uniref:Uncharacterized protein n=1 Tax=Saxophila tyrrhenica TaxID=1690608 RepID=A0AAV9PT22_9PEZI|nr:hypothetical protein LTR77_000614 [Saxophila tyrrhenica]
MAMGDVRLGEVACHCICVVYGERSVEPNVNITSNPHSRLRTTSYRHLPTHNTTLYDSKTQRDTSQRPSRPLSILFPRRPTTKMCGCLTAVSKLWRGEPDPPRPSPRWTTADLTPGKLYNSMHYKSKATARVSHINISIHGTAWSKPAQAVLRYPLIKVSPIVRVKEAGKAAGRAASRAMDQLTGMVADDESDDGWESQRLLPPEGVATTRWKGKGKAHWVLGPTEAQIGHEGISENSDDIPIGLKAKAKVHWLLEANEDGKGYGSISDGSGEIPIGFFPPIPSDWTAAAVRGRNEDVEDLSIGEAGGETYYGLSNSGGRFVTRPNLAAATPRSLLGL